MESVTLAIVADEPLFRHLLMTVLGQTEGVHIVGGFVGVEDGLAHIPRLAPDVVLVRLGSVRAPCTQGLDIQKVAPPYQSDGVISGPAPVRESSVGRVWRGPHFAEPSGLGINGRAEGRSACGVVEGSEGPGATTAPGTGTGAGLGRGIASAPRHGVGSGPEGGVRPDLRRSTATGLGLGAVSGLGEETASGSELSATWHPGATSDSRVRQHTDHGVGPDAPLGVNGGTERMDSMDSSMKHNVNPSIGGFAGCGIVPGTGCSTGHRIDPGTGRATGHRIDPGTGPSTSHRIDPETGRATGHRFDPGTGPSTSHRIDPETGRATGHRIDPGTGRATGHRIDPGHQTGAADGIQLGFALRRQLPDVGIVLLADHCAPEFLAAIPRDKAVGWAYLLKSSVDHIDTLLRAIRGTRDGLVVLDPQLIACAQDAHQPLVHLTPRQQDVLTLMADGLTNAAIARRLDLSEKTIQNQVNLIYDKLYIDRRNGDVQPRVQAVLTFLQHR